MLDDAEIISMRHWAMKRVSPFCIGRGVTARLDLLDLLQPEQQLVLRQRLGPAEAITLLFDDLLESRGTRLFACSASSIALCVPGS
nr:hypothetical protein [Bradyrhizobium sp. CCBAU 53340]